MRGVQELRRGLIMAQKRYELLKYNIKYRMERGHFYDMEADLATLQSNHRSLNLLDLGRKKEFFLLDHWSDATEYGGLSLTEL